MSNIGLANSCVEHTHAQRDIERHTHTVKGYTPRSVRGFFVAVTLTHIPAQYVHNKQLYANRGLSVSCGYLSTFWLGYVCEPLGTHDGVLWINV